MLQDVVDLVPLLRAQDASQHFSAQADSQRAARNAHHLARMGTLAASQRRRRPPPDVSVYVVFVADNPAAKLAANLAKAIARWVGAGTSLGRVTCEECVVYRYLFILLCLIIIVITC